jgi:alpha-1,2-mannosyltransferase
VQLWQGVTVLVLLGWVAIRSRGRGRARLRPVLAFLGASALAFSLVCLPFFLAAPDSMVRLILLDQIGRPSTRIALLDRLRALEGLPRSAAVPQVVLRLTPGWAVVIAAIVGAAATIVTGWRLVWTRPWAALVVVQALVVLATPSFFDDYPSLVAPAATLVLGTGIAWVVGSAIARGVRPVLAWLPVAGLVGGLAVVSAGHPAGSRIEVAALARDVSTATCVSADVPSLLVLTGGLRRDLAAGCPVVLDPTGTRYDTDRGRLPAGGAGVSRTEATHFQQAMVDWFTSGDTALFVSWPMGGLTPATQAAIRDHLPVEQHRGLVTVLRSAP